MKFAILLGLVSVLVTLTPNATGKEVTCYDCDGVIADGTDHDKKYSNCKDGKLADLQQRNCTKGCSVSHTQGNQRGIKFEHFGRDCMDPDDKIGCNKTSPNVPGVSFEKYEICNCEGDLCNGRGIDSVSPAHDGTSLDSRRISLLAILVPCVITAINAYY